MWLTLPFYVFCGFRSVAVNSVYKLQFFTFMYGLGLAKVSTINLSTKFEFSISNHYEDMKDDTKYGK